MRFKLLLLLCLYAGLVGAEWTGIRVELSDTETDWKFAGDVRQAQISRVSFEVEDTTETNLNVGFGIGYMSTRVVGSGAIPTRKFDAEYFEVLLRQHFDISESFALHAGLTYRYNSGHDADIVSPADIDWKETAVEIGVSMRFSNLRITPYGSYYNIDGDISSAGTTELFEIDDPVSSGVRFDYFVEDTAFIRLELQTGDYSGGYLTFARQY